MKKNVLIILLSIIVLSCNSNRDNSEIVNIESTLIAKGDLHGNRAEGIVKQNLVISDQATWSNLITKMNTVNNVSDRFSETDVDFSEYKIIVVFDDIKGSGGHSLALDIMANADNIIVKVTGLAPKGMATSNITQPFHIVKIKNSDLPILFE